MLPLKDNIPTDRFPLVTVLLIIINLLVFFYEFSLGTAVEGFMTRYGMTPLEITQGAGVYDHGGMSSYWTLFTSMFVHDAPNPLHVGMNMLFLWIFGNNVEDSMGSIRFIFFYLLCGLLAGFAQIAVDPDSMIPTIGASGAIAGVLGGYILLFPRARVTTLIFLGFFITFVELPAVIVLVLWMVYQIAGGIAGIYFQGLGEGGVAYFAHIGGFVAGLVAIKFFTRGKKEVHEKRGHMWRELRE